MKKKREREREKEIYIHIHTLFDDDYGRIKTRKEKSKRKTKQHHWEGLVHFKLFDLNLIDHSREFIHHGFISKHIRLACSDKPS